MRRILIHIVLPLIIAAIAVGNIVLFRLNNLLRPTWAEMTTLSFYLAPAAIVLFAALAVFRVRRWTLILSLVVSIVAAFVPQVVDSYAVSQQQAQEQAEGADLEMEFQSAYLDRSDDVDDRIAKKAPYTPQEALDFLEFAADSDLSYRSLPDHTPEAFALLEQAIEGGILDPNGLTTIEPIADSPAVTVTLAFYDKRIRPTSPIHIRKHDWDVLQILAVHGADTSLADAAALKADLAKTVSIDASGRYIDLK